MIIVERNSPKHPQASDLLRQSHAYLDTHFPPEENFGLDIDGLCVDTIRFFTARIGDTILGTGALSIKDGYGEVKSMFTSPAARGKGVASALLRQIEDEARAEGLPLLRLETGVPLVEAVALYDRLGFTRRGPFGDYPDLASSIFMEKAL